MKWLVLIGVLVAGCASNENVSQWDGNGEMKLFNMNKQIAQDGVFRNYKLMDGKKYIYDVIDSLESVAFYRDGELVRDSVIQRAPGIH